MSSSSDGLLDVTTMSSLPHHVILETYASAPYFFGKFIVTRLPWTKCFLERVDTWLKEGKWEKNL